MRARGHTKIFAIVTAVWMAFWIIGLPDYYQQYSFLFMLTFDAAILAPLSFIIYWVLKHTPPRFRVTLSLWLAFYITVPLFLYDYLYCAVYLGHRWSFLSEFWYLSAYYAIPWLLCPAIAHWLNRRDSHLGRRD